MPRDHDYVVYMLRCSDGRYYTGITNNLERRLREHQEGKSRTSFTYTRRPVVLVYAAHFQYVHDAIAWEKQLQRWSRKKKEALMSGRTDALPALSRRKKRLGR